MMSILCYVTFNDRGSVLKSVFGEWGPMFSPESPGLAWSAASQWGPGPPVRAQRSAQPLKTHPLTAPPPFSATCSPNLFKQIKSTLLFHLTFIWRATPPFSLCFLLVLCVSLSLRRTARLISALHPPERTKESQSTSIKFLMKFFRKLLRFNYKYIL